MSPTDQQTRSYRQILKATSVFGGVQVFNILLSLVRGKVTAMLLGSSGFAMFSLLSGPLALIGALTGLGISTSAVRDMALAHGEGNKERFGRTVKVFRRWVWFTGALGMVVTLVAAPWLSWSSFGNSDYTWAFLLLSVTLLMGAISTGQSSVLQATRRIKEMALSGMLSAASSFLISIPLYLWWGINGVVPLLVIASLISLLLSWSFSRRVPVQTILISWKESAKEGWGFVRVGILLTLSMQIQQVVGYGMTAFVSHSGGMLIAGLYAASGSVTWKCASLVFQAMSADYYPRLASVSNNHDEMRTTVNSQAEIGTLLMGAMTSAYVLLLPCVVVLLLSEDFLPMVPLCRWLMLSILIKSFSWCLSHIALAKSWPGVLLKLDLSTAVLDVIFSLGGYWLFGLEGLGIGAVLASGSFLLIANIAYRRLIGYRMSNDLLYVFSVLLGGNLVLILLLCQLPEWWGYAFGSILGVGLLCFSVWELNRRIDLCQAGKQLKQKFFPK